MRLSTHILAFCKYRNISGCVHGRAQPRVIAGHTAMCFPKVWQGVEAASAHIAKPSCSLAKED